MRPRTKHINNKYHHFRSHVDRKIIQIQQVKTEEQLADFFTKQCSLDLFRKFRKEIMGWDTDLPSNRNHWTRECENNDTNQTHRAKNTQDSNRYSLADSRSPQQSSQELRKVHNKKT
jgi:hypothetical protein